MKNYKKILNILSISLMVSGGHVAHIQAGSAGNVEAINSASENLRNIVGIEIVNSTPEQKKALGYSGEGVHVTAVIASHPADIAGMKVDDVITKIGDWEVTDVASVITTIDGFDAGIKYPFEVFRIVEGTPQKLTLNILIEKVQERSIGKIS